MSSLKKTNKTFSTALQLEYFQVSNILNLAAIVSQSTSYSNRSLTEGKPLVLMVGGIVRTKQNNGNRCNWMDMD